MAKGEECQPTEVNRYHSKVGWQSQSLLLYSAQSENPTTTNRKSTRTYRRPESRQPGVKPVRAKARNGPGSCGSKART